MPFMRYVLARFEQEQRDKAYRICVSDMVRILTKNTANLNAAYQTEGTIYTKRWIDIIKPKEEKVVTASGIINRIRDGLRRLAR